MQIDQLPVDTHQAVRRAARRLAGLFDGAFEIAGLKATQVSVLFEIARLSAGDPACSPTLHDLAIALSVQISSVTHALRPLKRDGLVEQGSDSADRRAKHCRLTSSGTERLRTCLEVWANANLRVEEALGRDHAAELRALAARVAFDDFLLEYENLTCRRDPDV